MDTKQRKHNGENIKQRILQKGESTKQRLLQNSELYKTANPTKQKKTKRSVNQSKSKSNQ